MESKVHSVKKNVLGLKGKFEVKSMVDQGIIAPIGDG